jgi:hypothetical protein
MKGCFESKLVFDLPEEVVGHHHHHNFKDFCKNLQN